jgi:hypothetical protein
MTDSGLYQVVRDRSEQAGIGKVYTHLFRHTFAHTWLVQGGQEGDLMRLTGALGRCWDATGHQQPMSGPGKPTSVYHQEIDYESTGLARFKVLPRGPRSDENLVSDDIRVLRGFCDIVMGVLCSGLLGYAELVGDGIPKRIGNAGIRHGASQGRFADREPAAGDWMVFHHEGFRQAEDGTFDPLTGTAPNASGQKIGQRKLPSEFELGSLAPHPDREGRGVIARFAIVPARITCPKCERRYIVNRPDIAALGYRTANRVSPELREALERTDPDFRRSLG